MQGRLSATGVTIDATITMSQYEEVTGHKVGKELRAQVAKVGHVSRHSFNCVSWSLTISTFSTL